MAGVLNEEQDTRHSELLIPGVMPVLRTAKSHASSVSSLRKLRLITAIKTPYLRTSAKIDFNAYDEMLRNQVRIEDMGVRRMDKQTLCEYTHMDTCVCQVLRLCKTVLVVDKRCT